MSKLVDTMVDMVCFRNNMGRKVEEHMTEAMTTIDKEYKKTLKLEGRERYDAEVKLTQLIDELLLTE